MTTPRLTEHARVRCREMDISTKVAKRIVRHAELRYPGRETWSGGETVIAVWSGAPLYAVVYVDDDPRVVVTVLFNVSVPYVRDGAAYREVEACPRPRSTASR